jgi:hypothetical protein
MLDGVGELGEEGKHVGIEGVLSTGDDHIKEEDGRFSRFRSAGDGGRGRKRDGSGRSLEIMVLGPEGDGGKRENLRSVWKLRVGGDGSCRRIRS